MSRRRSWSCLPRASPSSSFARPRGLMYSRSGTIVWPLALVRPEQLVDLGAVEQQLAGPLRLVVVAVAAARTARCGRRSATPRRARCARRRRRGSTLPARIDLISVPVRTRPASNVSSMVNSCRARRLRAMVVSSRMGWLLRDRRRVGDRASRSRPRRTNAGPMRAGVRVAYHPQGVRLDGHLLRGGAATRTVDHCTSPPFVPTKPYPMTGSSARARSGGHGRQAATAAPVRPTRRGPRAPWSRTGSGRRGAGGTVTATSGVRPVRGSSACRASASGRP